MKRGIQNAFLVTCILLTFFASGVAQVTAPVDGVLDKRSGTFAFLNATIHTQFDQVIENASMLIKDGKIVAVGTRIAIPADAVQIPLEGKHIYPAFIELYGQYGLPEGKAEGLRPKQQPQALSNKTGAYSWNEAVRPEFEAASHFTPNAKQADPLRQAGFGAINTHQLNGISRGASCLVSTAEGAPHERMIKASAAHHLSFRKGKSTQNYPSSLMGAIALLRQVHYDAQWYKNANQQKEKNLSLEAWNDRLSLPQIFGVGNKLELLRAAKIAQEFNQKYIFKGAGDEYQRLEAIKSLGMPLIIPVNFPKPYNVSDPYDARLISFSDLKHWELAPKNPAALVNAGLDVVLTTHGLKKKSDFLPKVMEAIKHGLSEENALKAITYTPARLLGVENIIGSLKPGYLASFIITSGALFEKKTAIHETWVQGEQYVYSSTHPEALSGRFELEIGDTSYLLNVKGKPGAPSMQIELNDSTSVKVKSKIQSHNISLSFSWPTQKEGIRLAGAIQSPDLWSGNGQLGSGEWVKWRASKTGEIADKPEEKKESASLDSTINKYETTGAVTYPFTAYGWTERPKEDDVLIKNATVWTNERAGILTNTDVLVRNGKIVEIGQQIDVDVAQVVDGTGKHLTCGIIDEHSHIGISRGVNEGTQASSAEVRIGDVINSEDVNIYRQLAGGVTSAQLLHGSANPIGGQSAIIKLRWGFLPEEMKFKEAAPFIKFALGENVKQSNWGNNYRSRYPQTRMGVEQFFIDHFNRALDYQRQKTSGSPYRKDLEMETLLEIIEGKRFITCHSYQQGEINMLMKIAEQFGFTLNTFTHILEGYKVADKMAKHGAGASSFSDWWAYKFEVIDAIPHNGALLHSQGVITAFNSDDAEMARHLNQEAAKAVKYGGVSEEEAWKFVTLNPAILLHIDDFVGSIKTGKHADLVLWSDNPLSVYAMPEKTWVDGICLFDRTQDKILREAIRSERNRIVQKMMQAKKNGNATQPLKGKKHHLYHCDDIHDEME